MTAWTAVIHNAPEKERKPMTISMLDQMLFDLGCGHTVVLGRLQGIKEWTCEECGKRSNLDAEPFKGALAMDLDTAQQIDLQVEARGGTTMSALLTDRQLRRRGSRQHLVRRARSGGRGVRVSTYSAIASSRAAFACSPLPSLSPACSNGTRNDLT